MSEAEVPPPPDEATAESGVPWRVRDIVFGVLAALGATFTFFILYALFVRVTGVGGLTGLAAFEFASVVTYVALAGGLWIFAVRMRRSTLRAAGFEPVGAGVIALMVPLTIGVLFVNLLIQLGVMAVFGEIRTASDQLSIEEGSLDMGAALVLLFSTAVVAPVVEEFLFRGLLHRALKETRGVKVAAVITSVIFALTHFIPLLMPSLFFLGLALTWVAERYRSIVPAIALHGLFNTIATLALVSTG